MKPAITAPPQEVELKLALLAPDPKALAAHLARLPVLARRHTTRQALHNIYYDTPEMFLQSQRVALRLRRVGSEAKPQWLQTFKSGGRSDSALHQRAEWEVSVPGQALSIEALQGTAWTDIDPDGSVFNALQPVFHTSFERTTWLVRRRDRSVIEVALDIGVVVAGDARAPLCELELELKEGGPLALFELAGQIAGELSTLPAAMSKSERGYALAAGRLNQPQLAKAPALRGKLSVRGAAGPVLQEMFGHFTGNLQALMVSDDAEVAHQARVGWRRFRSGLRLFDGAIGADAVPPRQALEPLLEFLGELRDLDVAREQTLPALAERFAAGNGLRAQVWTAMMQTLEDAATTRRKSVRYALQSPAVGVCLLDITHWLEALASPLPLDEEKRCPVPILRDWAERRVDQLCKKLKKAQKNARTETDLHRVRIVAKRVRYNIEALRDVLPKQATQRRYQHAKALQTRLGATRDVLQAAGLVAALDVDPGLQEYLRGYATGSTLANESERHLPLID